MSSWGKNLPYFYSVKYRAYLYIYTHILLTMTINPSESTIKYSVMFTKEDESSYSVCRVPALNIHGKIHTNISHPSKNIN